VNTRAGDDCALPGQAEIVQREFLDGLFVFVGIVAHDGTLVETNERTLAALGVARAEVLGTGFLQIAQRVLDPRSLQVASALLDRAAQGESAQGELAARFSSDQTTILDCSFRPLRDPAGKVVQIAVTGVDVTSHKLAERSLQKLNRELRLLSECSQMLIRAPDERRLLEGICTLLVDVGGYRLAWVGFALNDVQQTVRPVAIAGTGVDYVERRPISWGDSEFGQGPTGRAIRDRKATVCRDIAGDPVFEPWRSEATLRGFGSSIALPLLVEGGCIGALNVYSDQADSFESTEVGLLTELAGDLAYGIEALRMRDRRKHAEDQMGLFRQLLQHTQEMIYVTDARSGRILDCNESAARNLEYTRDELLRLSVPDFSMRAAQQPWTQRYQYIKNAGTVISEGLFRTRTGRMFPVEVGLRYIEHGGVEYITGVSRDITERKRQSEHIDRLTRILRMQSGINAAVLRIQN